MLDSLSGLGMKFGRGGLEKCCSACSCDELVMPATLAALGGGCSCGCDGNQSASLQDHRWC